MKTPTLIVRLLGLYLLVTWAVSLIEFQRMTAMVPLGQINQVPILAHIGIYGWVGMVAGIVATAFAGPLARILTFDSDPLEKRSSRVKGFFG